MRREDARLDESRRATDRSTSADLQTGRRQYLKGIAAAGVGSVGLLENGTTTASATPDEGGPVIRIGLDSEMGDGSSSHGPPEDHAAMVDSLLENVTNDGDGIMSFARVATRIATGSIAPTDPSAGETASVHEQRRRSVTA